eukprot:TRINITY_DN1046_c0_g1_i4.p1 TRINITY_DN1046_c0_g1~~TRINITY_DN1046_c0_g1_i4.p1  ORF type:complete len:888 (+),score=310.47 TRINITY_DN1046_c0_g1_i4:440-3103(+)
MHITLDKSAGVQVVQPQHFAAFVADVKEAGSVVPDGDTKTSLETVLAIPALSTFLLRCSRADVFDSSVAADFSSNTKDLCMLRSLKQLKYFYNLPAGQLMQLLAGVVASDDVVAAKPWTALAERVLADEELCTMLIKHLIIGKTASKSLKAIYEENAQYLLENDPHALYPTSIYRQGSGHVTSSDDSSRIEGVMSTTITTSIEIVRDVLNPKNHQLRDMYKPLKRCVAVVDERLDKLYGQKLSDYFLAHDIAFEKMSYRCMEVDKDISTVEKMLVDLKGRRVSRNEPVLIVGGGVMADVGGFACALYHRNTPYVMLCTSIVSGIDAGPSPRTCCDGLGYKNVFGAYHPPVLTLTDRYFFHTLEKGWIRHGIAEIIKMAVTKDHTLFEALEEAGEKLVDTKFGIEDVEAGSSFDTLSESIIAKAMDGYVRSEYGNLWETHQCRPHAYGHTWSPGFELQAGLLHGHAVSIGMGYGAYLSFLEGWISETDFHRILKVISTVGLSLVHPILDNPNSLWQSQIKMTEKRGGNLCAPLPRGSIGKCGYLNDLTRARLEATLIDYKELCKAYPRGGAGIEPHCRDVGLEDPSTVKQHADHAVHAIATVGPAASDEVPEANGNGNGAEAHGAEANGNGNSNVYNDWIAKQQVLRNQGATSSSLMASMVQLQSVDTEAPPAFPHTTLFHEGGEEYAQAMTTPASADFVNIAKETVAADLFAPCMVGAIEGQFLKMMAGMTKSKRVLDIGTFTGYSALAFAGGVPADGEVVTIEADEKCADVAQKCFDAATEGRKIKLVRGDAMKVVSEMADAGEKFDIVFLDADKVNYAHYYEAGLKMLAEGGLIMADNALCSLVYADDDPVRLALHAFAQKVRADTRVEQVMLTVREGILMVRRV